MDYIKSYKLFENDDSYYQKKIDLIQSYYDCFADYIDMGMCAHLVVGYDVIDIKDMDEVKKNIHKYGDDLLAGEMVIEMRGFIEHEYENDPETLREICNYLGKNLKSDEKRFEKITGSELENTFSGVNHRSKPQYDDFPTYTKRYVIKGGFNWNKIKSRLLLTKLERESDPLQYLNSFSDVPDGDITNITIVHKISC